MLRIDEKLIELDDLTDELTRAFLRLELVQIFQRRQQAFASDQVLQQQVKKLEENRAFVTMRPEIRALQQEVMMADATYQLKLAENDMQSALSELAKKIAGVISVDIFVDENLPLKKGGHHGRHHHGARTNQTFFP
ncbi:MAG: hypothetical protein LBS41_02385 [Streptococcaceae bacterium]|jgi:cell fate (sporulation/competence/biofilm development) regulator YlbF (YheA/YmcA/DUF963 family)|nr:hypothetical protein [Streptococcaceae bacterium]